MSKIIIFKEIQEKALDNSLEDLVLFGEANFIKNKESSYDLIFHAKQTNPYDKEKPCSLVIPVLRINRGYSQEKDIERIEEAVKKAYMENPSQEFTTYAVASEFLDFYELITNNKNLNPIPIKLGKYKHPTEKELLERLKKPHIFMRQIQEKRRIIDNRY